MDILVVGGTGAIGSAVAERLRRDHRVVVAARSTDPAVDVTDPDSIRRLFDAVGPLDAIVAACGDSPFKPLLDLTRDDYLAGFRSKALGQIELVTQGASVLRPGGSFTLTTGILTRLPIRGSAVATAVNGALEAFVAAAAQELREDRRINAISPSVILETPANHAAFPGILKSTLADVTAAYERSVAGSETGRIFRLDGTVA